MALALIGSNLRKGAQDVRWQQIADKLEKSHGAFDIKLPQQEWNYQHPTLKASIDLSVEGLSNEVRPFFDMLVVFDYDTLVPQKTLATMWGLDIFDADIKMTGTVCVWGGGVCMCVCLCICGVYACVCLCVCDVYACVCQNIFRTR